MTITLTLTVPEAKLIKYAVAFLIPALRAAADANKRSAADVGQNIVKRIADALNAGAEVREALDLASEDAKL